MKIRIIVLCCLFLFFCPSLFTQSHISVSVENHVYNILEQAEMRGLCAPLSGIKPYTQTVVVKTINEILNSENADKLNNTEREILKQYLEQFSKPKIGLDLMQGNYYNETTFGSSEIPISANLDFYLDIEGSGGFYDSFNEQYYGTEIWLGVFFTGDVGRNVSYRFGGEGGLLKVPRKYLGEYDTYHTEFISPADSEYQNQVIEVYSEPLTHFPYSYKRRWDASVHYLDSLAIFSHWPNQIAGTYNLLSELTASFVEDKLTFRLGRLSREWGSVPFGSSMQLNQMARPFLGIEAEFTPLSWFNVATMTGILEFDPIHGEKKSGMISQKAYSVTLLQFRYKNYLFLDLGEAVVWPKRFELGYISPITNTIFYQNNIGDFDNMAATVNLKAQYPGVGNIWVSLFWDEAFWVPDWYELDRTMLAGQAGINFFLPFLSFSSLRLSYTKVNPYTYTHNRNYNPWYNLAMETAYTNNGVSLGYYIPPNSDEILVRFATMPAKNLTTNLQYQLIRHGADFGPSAVDGSNLLSELDPWGREGKGKPVLKRYFLQDGAYQWLHAIKFSGEWNLPTAPLTFFCEVGTVISYFTNIAAPANITGRPYKYSIVDTSDYPKSTGFITKLGIRVFPR